MFCQLCPFVASFRAQVIDSTLNAYIRAKALKPAAYVVEKFQTHDVVFLGETHAIRENLLFVQSILPTLYKNGVYNLGMEFGAFEVQDKLNALIAAEEYDEAQAKEIMYAYNVTWAFQEYIDVYKAAWKLNRTLPKGAKKFRVLNLSYVFRWDQFDGRRTQESMRAVFNQGTADQFRAKIIEREVLDQGEKILALVGTPHAYTKYGSPYFKYNGDNFCDFDRDWLGNRLYKKYPERVFNILLHQAFTQKIGDAYVSVSPANGAIERLMAANDNQPAGFDLLHSPVGALPDNSLNAVCYHNFTLGQYFDGYIFLKPFHALEGCTVVKDFVNAGNIEHTLKNFPDPDWHEKVTNIEDVYRFIESIPLQSIEALKKL